MLFIRSVKILVKHFLRQLSNQTDARVVVSDTFLNVRLTPDNSFQWTSFANAFRHLNHQRKRFRDLLTCARTFLPSFLFRRPSPGNVPSLELPGYVCYGSKFGFATLLVSEQFCAIWRSWNFEEVYSNSLWDHPGGGSVCAPDSSKSLETYEACVSSVTKVLREGRQGGAKDFHISRDPNVELGVMSTDEIDTEELDGMYGPLCWQGYDHDPGGVKKLMWHGIMKEFNCKASSTWSRCGRTREMSYMHKHWSKKKEEETS